MREKHASPKQCKLPREFVLLAQDYLALEGEAGEGALLEHHDVVSLQTEVVVRTKINNKVIKK